MRGLELTLFHTNVYRHGIQITRKSSGCVLLTLNASSEHDRYKFVMDLQESIYEMNQMEDAISEMTTSAENWYKMLQWLYHNETIEYIWMNSFYNDALSLYLYVEFRNMLDNKRFLNIRNL